MYAKFFGLQQEPFSIAPDPRYLFMSERHREAMAHLLYGVNSGGGFVLLTGEIGAGKTTVCRCFLEKVPKRCNVAYIFNPKLTVEELLKTVCDEFRIPLPAIAPGSVKPYVDALNRFLLETHAVGQNNVLIIDEAQNLSADVLEQLRLLTNLETSERKLLQIMLIGQPELRAMLARPELEQLAQRVIARYHLGALTEVETAQYIRHRLSVAGLAGPMPFERKALQRIHQLARGVPRRINLLADRALLGAYASERDRVDCAIVEAAAAEVFETRQHKPRKSRPPSGMRWDLLGAGLGLGVAGGMALFALLSMWRDNGSTTNSANATANANASTSALARAAPASAAGAASAAAAARAASVALPPVGSVASASSAAKPAFLSPSDLSMRFGNQPLLRDDKQAWRELAARAWNVALPEGSEPCAAALRQQQLQCYRSAASSLVLIRQLARPGIVALQDDSGQPAYALLTGLGAQSATLRMNGVTQTISLLSLAGLWRGEFATLWRAPPGYADGRLSLESAAGAEWLATRLAALDGDAPNVRSAVTPLKTRLQTFQVAQGLKPDGVAGPVTLMLLNRAGGVVEPRLPATE